MVDRSINNSERPDQQRAENIHAPKADAAEISRRREQRNQDALVDALNVADHSIATAATMLADLQFYAHEIREVAEAAIELTPSDPRERASVLPMVDMALRVYRQSERLLAFIAQAKRVQVDERKRRGAASQQQSHERVLPEAPEDRR
jgi:hypothetical protein